MKYRFRVKILEEAKDFLDSLDDKSNRKVIYNIWKSRSVVDPELFKKLDGEIWEFRTRSNKNQIRILAFWDKSGDQGTVVAATNGFVKKTGKVPKTEIQRAERIRKAYFEQK